MSHASDSDSNSNSNSMIKQVVEIMHVHAVRIHARDPKVRAVLVVERLAAFLDLAMLTMRRLAQETDGSEDRDALLQKIDQVRRIWVCSINELISYIDPQDD